MSETAKPVYSLKWNLSGLPFSARSSWKETDSVRDYVHSRIQNPIWSRERKYYYHFCEQSVERVVARQPGNQVRDWNYRDPHLPRMLNVFSRGMERASTIDQIVMGIWNGFLMISPEYLVVLAGYQVGTSAAPRPEATTGIATGMRTVVDYSFWRTM